MSIIGGIAGSVLGLGASIYGGIKSAQAANAGINQIKSARTASTNFYNRRFGEDFTQRGDNQNTLNNGFKQWRDHNIAALQTDAVMGTTNGYRNKLSSQNQMANAFGQVAASNAAERSSDAKSYLASQQGFAKMESDLDMAKANAIASSAGKAAGALTNAGNAVDGYIDSKKQA